MPLSKLMRKDADITQLRGESQQNILLEDLNTTAEKFQKCIDITNKKILLGQEDVVEKTFIALVAGGHTLYEGVPGLGKTRLINNIAPMMSLESNRIQCTPDLMPSDILGVERPTKDQDGNDSFKFEQGPVFTELLKVDEINRAAPRTQSALLQGMQEKKITLPSGKTVLLANPFMVMASQNPIEQEGTYPLPEAQLDRFLMKINLGYPDRRSESLIGEKTTSTSLQKYLAEKGNLENLHIREEEDNDVDLKDDERNIFGRNELALAQSLARTLPIGQRFMDAVMNIIWDLRPSVNQNAPKLVKDSVAWEPGPRATQAFLTASRARALIGGRTTPSFEDIAAVAQPVLAPRMALTFQASRSVDEIIDDVVNQEISPHQ